MSAVITEVPIDSATSRAPELRPCSRGPDNAMVATAVLETVSPIPHPARVQAVTPIHNGTPIQVRKTVIPAIPKATKQVPAVMMRSRRSLIRA